MTELNLLPSKYKEKKNKFYKMKLTASSLLLIAAFVAVGIFAPTIVLFKLKLDSEALKKEITQKHPILLENKALNTTITNYQSYTGKLDTIANQKILASKVLSDLMLYIPNDVILGSITYSKTKISFPAKTTNYYSAYAIAANLETSVRFKDCKINNINFDEASQAYTFNINISNIGGDSNGKTK